MSDGVFKGIGVSKGVSVGRCLLLETQEKNVGKTESLSGAVRYRSSEDEADRFASAVEQVRQELLRIKAKISGEAGTDAAEIFEAQVLMLEDPLFMSEVINKIHDDESTAEAAVDQTIARLREKFSTLTSSYMRERSEDIRDLGLRLSDVLKGRREHIQMLAERVKKEGARITLASRSLAAATLAHFDRKLVAGIVTEEGGATSHLAIIARSLRIPTVLGVKSIIGQLKDGDQTLVDGDKGEVIINPSETEAEIRMKRVVTESTEAVSTIEPVMTTDGHRVQVFANVANLEGIRDALSSGAEGIGLFRTEFVYFDRDDLPTEDELFQVMKESISVMRGKPLIVRTLDIGGDKKPTYVNFPVENNPALGLRGIRHSLKNPVTLETQLAAILRASTNGDIWIMFPMITTVYEIREAKGLVENVKGYLRRMERTFDENIKIGIMVETPSAALMSMELAREVDFFSIGTNDLAQYTLAADRENESVATTADPMEPSVLRLVHQTIEGAHASNRHAGMCGEMAADPEAIPILLGMGLDQFSVDPSNIQYVKRIIRSLNLAEASEACSDVLSMVSAREVREYSRKRFRCQKSIQ